MLDQEMNVIIDLDDTFFEFHRLNPHIYELYKEYAFKAIEAGFKRYSVTAIMNVIRWERNVKSNDFESFKMNSVYTSRYARLLMYNEPALRGFFEIRKLKTRSRFMGSELRHPAMRYGEDL